MIEERILNRLADRLAAALAPPAVPLVRFVVDGACIGALERERVDVLRRFGDTFAFGDDVLTLAPDLRSAAVRTQALARVARALGDEGRLSAWRDEPYAVAPAFGRDPLFLLERAAARYFGIATCAVHVNGTTTAADGGTRMWLGRRSASKAIDPGCLDNLVGGGIAAGADVAGTLAKEAWEEAGLPAALAMQARPAGALPIRRLQPDGLQRETLFVHDLHLAPAIVPANQDGEVVAFRLVAPHDAALLAGNTDGPDVVTADASLVIADWLLRHGHVPAGSAAAGRLDALRRER